MFILQWPSLHWKILIMLLSVSTNFSSKLQWDALFDRIAYDYSRADREGLCDHLRDVPWEDTLNLVPLLLLVNL